MEYSSVIERDTQCLFDQAATTNWECARMFSSRSNELLLLGTIPSECYRLLDYTVSTTRIEYLPRHSLPKFPPVADFCAWAPVGGANVGMTAFELRGDPGKTFHLKQARSNVGPALLQASSMRESVDYSSPRNVGAREGLRKVLTWSLKYMLFEHIDALKPVLVAWEILPPEWIAPRKPSKQFTATTEELVARWRVTAQRYTDEDATRAATAYWGAGRECNSHRHLATQFAITALQGLALDVFLANLYGWGVYDKPQLSYCPDDPSSLDSGGKMYRMSADTAFGTLGYGIEHLNDDRRKPDANLEYNTFRDGAFDLPFFRKQNKGVNSDDTFSTGVPLLLSVEEQFTSLRKLVAEHRVEVLEMFAELLIPADTLRVAGMYPKEMGWVRDARRDEFWCSFVFDRPRYVLRRLRVARDAAAQNPDP
ncbi:hypothetical protein T492DRAFT_846644 [Pavlovales sp. CCMP2436]|nr:hypothetical protein T492DRAFT_846644 [Pavlovales sp. CCMP2436]